MVKVGSKIRITSDNYKEVGKVCKVTHVARSVREHPGYDEGVGGALVDCKIGKRHLGYSLYEWEFEEL